MPIASPPITYRLDRPGCSGIACGPHLSIRNPGNLEQALPSGSTGAICVRGLPTFQGYEVSPDINVPLDTSAFTSEGWFDSGDMGHMDSDGYLFITGRSKEIINKGGEVISPFEVEEAIVTAAKRYVKVSHRLCGISETVQVLGPDNACVRDRARCSARDHWRCYCSCPGKAAGRARSTARFITVGLFNSNSPLF
jgi:acyl-CoA synthetase (AMP-forming)/AMP-acid ligase II